MSGLLRHLAAQALNPTRSPIHARAALPFAPPLADARLDPAETAVTAAIPAPHAGAAAATTAQPVVPTPLTRADTPQSHHEPAVPPHPILPPAQPGAAPETVATRPAGANGVHQPGDLNAPTPYTATDSTPPRRPEHRTPDAHSEPPSTPLSAHPGAVDPAPPAAAAAPATPRQEPPLHAPPRLLAEVARAPSDPRVPGTQRPTPGRDAPDEVHVHIGRIEVVAHYPQAPAAAPRAKPRAPMSLDDYLAKRGEGSA